MGHTKPKQEKLFKTKSSTAHGGELRKKRSGRGSRPLSGRDSLHAVFKINKSRLTSGSLRTSRNFKIIQYLMKKYSARFAVKIEQFSIQNDHIHILIRAPRRFNYHYFFRVLAGQIAQVLQKEGLVKAVTHTPTRIKNKLRNENKKGTGLWKLRPFSRVVKGLKAFKTVRDYVLLNEKEALGLIPYRKTRLRGLLDWEWGILRIESKFLVPLWGFPLKNA